MEQDAKLDARAVELGRRGPQSNGELSIKEHILMVNDLPRGQRYYEALRAKIRPGDVVLEVGTGAGLLSCMAVQLGAKHVYTVEQSPELHRVAARVFAANGLSHKITLINGHSRDLLALGAIPEPVDVFVTETIGTEGLDEGILTIFEDVKPLLSPEARVIPENVTFNHCLVNMTGIRERVEVLEPIFGFDLSALNRELEPSNLYWLNPLESWRELSTTARTRIYDLLNLDMAESTQTLSIIDTNMCDGMLTWAEFKLAEDVFLDTRYRKLGSSWANSVQFMERGVIECGQSCTSRFEIRKDRIGWTMDWSIGSS